MFSFYLKSFAGSKNQDAGNTSGADQSPNGFADQPDQHDLQALQNHNLLIALGAAQQAPGARHFAMPVSIKQSACEWFDRLVKATDLSLHWINVILIISNWFDVFDESFCSHISSIRTFCDNNNNNLPMLAMMCMVTTTAIIRQLISVAGTMRMTWTMMTTKMMRIRQIYL